MVAIVATVADVLFSQSLRWQCQMSCRMTPNIFDLQVIVQDLCQKYQDDCHLDVTVRALDTNKIEFSGPMLDVEHYKGHVLMLMAVFAQENCHSEFVLTFPKTQDQPAIVSVTARGKTPQGVSDYTVYTTNQKTGKTVCVSYYRPWDLSLKLADCQLTGNHLGFFTRKLFLAEFGKLQYVHYDRHYYEFGVQHILNDNSIYTDGSFCTYDLPANSYTDTSEFIEVD